MGAIDGLEVPLEIQDSACLIGSKLDEAHNKIVDELGRNGDKPTRIGEGNFIIDQHVLSRILYINLIEYDHAET